MAKTLTSQGSKRVERKDGRGFHGLYLKIAIGLLGKILLHDLLFLLPEVVVFLYLELWDALLGLFLGTIAISIGFIGIAKSYEKYGTISVGKARIPKHYFLRYVFYAFIFLLSSSLSRDKVSGIIGTFLGMINFKLVLFVFGWRWNEWGREQSLVRRQRYK